MAKRGRPSKKTQKVVDEIIDRLANGEPLTRICNDPHIPHFATVFRWQSEDAEFREQSMRAMESGTHRMAGECLLIADDETIDPQHKRFMIDTRLRLIGKWNRKAYGEHHKLEHTGKDDTPLVPVLNVTIGES